VVKRFIYRLSERELGNILAEKTVPLEVLHREGEYIEIATYEAIEGLKPLRVEELEEEWHNWEADFGPVEVGGFVILPPWKRVLRINPGMAFGTGLHPTTKLSLRMLELYMREGYYVIDVGTGSGILAIAAKMLRADRVLAIDISRDAIMECERNARLNGVCIECSLASAGDVEGSFDLLIANLEIEIFREEIKSLCKLFRRVALFSGIYKERELKEFLHLIEKCGLRKDKIFELEEWFGVSVKI
jgi:ribosomal protein L11 methyltransferase